MGVFDSPSKRYYQQLLKERGLRYPRPSPYLEELAKAQQVLSSGDFPAITSSPIMFFKAMMDVGRGLSPFVESIHNRLISSLTLIQRTYWSAQLWSGVFPTGEYNAHAIRVPKDRGYVFLINEGLCDLIHYFLTLLVSTMGAADFDEKGRAIPGTEATEPELTIDEAASRLQKLIQQYVAFEGAEAMGATARIQIHDIYRRHLHGLLVVYSNMFVQAHELAHAFLGHLDKPAQRILSARAGDKPISVQDKTWEEEYAADFSGCVLMIKSVNREADHDYYPMLFEGAITGPFVFLRLAQLIEKVSQTRYESHPPTELREKNLMAKLQAKVSEAKYPKECFQLTDAMLDLIDQLSRKI